MPDLEVALTDLELDLQRLGVDIARFFNGALETPPGELQNDIRGRLRHLRTSAVRSTADQFRLTALEARFNSLSELFGRRLRDQEQGASAPRPAARRQAPDVQEGVLLGERPAEEAVSALYRELSRRGRDAFKADLDQFRSYVTNQVRRIRDQTGCSEVRFRVVSEDGKVSLRARPSERNGRGPSEPSAS